MMQQNIAPFIRNQKQKQLLIRAILIMYLNQPIIQLYQTCKNLFENVRSRLLIQS